MVQLFIDRGADINVKGRVCHLFPVFCYNTVINVYPFCVGCKLLCSPGSGLCFMCACTNTRRHVRAFLCVYMYVLCMYVCDCVHVHMCVCVCVHVCFAKCKMSQCCVSNSNGCDACMHACVSLCLCLCPYIKCLQVSLSI